MSTLLSTSTLAALAAAFLTALAAAAWLPGRARRLGWIDAAEGCERKLQRRPVPAVGGAICLAGLCAGWAVLVAAGRAPDAPLPGRGLGRLLAALLGDSATLWPLGGVLCAFGVGLIDDRVPGGLGPRAKLAGQFLSGVVLGAPLLASASAEPLAIAGALLLLGVGAAVAINAINTFDNADGAAGGLLMVATLASAPLVAASLLPFLWLNLARRRDGEARAYLGDSGSHLLGMLMLLTPAAWPVLALPLFDLARLSVVRTRAGSAPWIGDRRHLAHRMARAGRGRFETAALLALAALPAALLGWWGSPLTVALAAWLLSRSPGADDERSPAGGALPGVTPPTGS